MTLTYAYLEYTANSVNCCFGCSWTSTFPFLGLFRWGKRHSKAWNLVNSLRVPEVRSLLFCLAENIYNYRKKLQPKLCLGFTLILHNENHSSYSARKKHEIKWNWYLLQWDKDDSNPKSQTRKPKILRRTTSIIRHDLNISARLQLSRATLTFRRDFNFPARI